MIERQNGGEDEVVILITTFPDQESAHRIGGHWVESRLAACVNLVPGVESLYRWEGKVETGAEILALVKTTRARLPELEASLRSLHPYELPELLVIPPTDGSSDYLGWVRNGVSTESPPGR